jgi:hypothetical protein
MHVAQASPAAAASIAPAAPIPFSRDAGSGDASGGASLLVAALLLAAAFAVLWVLKRRGWRGLPGQPAAVPQGVKVTQRLRLGPACSAYVLQDGEDRLLVVEARQGVQVTALRAAPAADRGEAQ